MIGVFTFIEKNKRSIEEGIYDEMRQYVTNEDLSEDALRAVVSQALEAFEDVIVTAEDDLFEPGYKSLLPIAAAHPSGLSGVLHLPLVIADVVRRAHAAEFAASTAPLTVSDDKRHELVAIGAAAAGATCAMFNAFQAELGRGTAPDR